MSGTALNGSDNRLCSRSQPPSLDKYPMWLARAGGYKCCDQRLTPSIRANGRRLCVARRKWRSGGGFEMNTGCRRNSRPNRQRASSARISNTIPTRTLSVRVDRRRRAQRASTIALPTRRRCARRQSAEAIMLGRSPSETPLALNGKRLTSTPTTTRIREIFALGTQTTASLTPLLGRCLRVLLLTKFYSNRIGSFFRATAEMAATPNVAAISLIGDIPALQPDQSGI
jgi:hypothetical protein